jgi:mannose-6-phosphate isomerase-like protein (cupin superfamily)
MMKPPTVDPTIFESIDVSPMAGGSKTTVLFRGENDSDFSLLHAWFGAGFRLPRHSHSADCLYFVLSGKARVGKRVVGAGDGFLVRADQPYAYEAGEEGVEVLEFRHVSAFDMRIFDQTVERWKPIVAAAIANREKWSGPR